MQDEELSREAEDVTESVTKSVTESVTKSATESAAPHEAQDEEPEADAGTEQETHGSGKGKKSEIVLAPDEKKPGFAGEVFDWYRTGLTLLIGIMLVFMFITRTSNVDGTSMLPTLEDKQYLAITDFFYEPARNDIVVVWAPNLPNDDGGRGKAIVKRVIGLSGDTIDIDFSAGRVTRNGELLDVQLKDGVLWEDGHMINTLTNEDELSDGHFVVPEGHIFVMGDNRNGSTDSRSSFYVGYVDKRQIVGKAYLRVFPFDKFGFIG